MSVHPLAEDFKLLGKYANKFVSRTWGALEANLANTLMVAVSVVAIGVDTTLTPSLGTFIKIAAS